MKKKPLSLSSIRRKGRPVKHKLDLSAFHCPFCGSLELKVHSRYGKVEKRYRLRCLYCHKTFSERKGTALFHAKKPAKDVARMVQALVDGNGIRGASRVCGVHQKTIALCLRKAGHHADAVSSNLTKNVKLNEVQVDEAHATVFKKERNLSPKDRMLHPDAGTAWLFTAIDAATKFIPLMDVATDLKAKATERFFRKVAKRLNKPWPLFATDMRKAYKEAVRAAIQDDAAYVQAEGHHYHKQSAEKCTCGWDKGRSEIILGDKAAIEKHYKDSPVSNKINTAFIEVFHKTLRTANRRLQRKTNGVSKKRRNLRLQLTLYTAYYNLIKEHRSLRIENGHNGSIRKWDVQTPAMAAKVADHKWTVEELLFKRL